MLATLDLNPASLKARILRAFVTFHCSHVPQVRGSNAMMSIPHNLHTLGASQFWRMEYAVRQAMTCETVLDVL